jgi:Baseplate J-like protein
MPIKIPTLDDRKYQDLLDEALARIPVHTPEWTNFNKSDPGVTLIELFAFMTETLLYRTNQIPERNRRKFLSLLGVGLQGATSAVGLVTFANERGPLETITLNSNMEVSAGQVPFRTWQGLDVLPVEAQVYYKRELPNPSSAVLEHYRQLYASYLLPFPGNMQPQLYETVLLSATGSRGVDTAQDTVDGSLWIALLLRSGDRPDDNTQAGRDRLLATARQKIAGATLSIGAVPLLADTGRTLSPGGQTNSDNITQLEFQLPKLLPDAALPNNNRTPQYRSLETKSTDDLLARPGVVQVTLPSDPNDLQLWNNVDPLEAGVGDFPPSLDDTKVSDRLITWIRVRPPIQGARPSSALRPKFSWVGINAAMVSQRAHVANEILPAGTGEPGQIAKLANANVIPGSVRITLTSLTGPAEEWVEIEDFLSAGPEVPVPDLRQPPGSPSPKYSVDKVKVFTLDAEAGQLRFGDGEQGARPPVGAVMRADYDYARGGAGNVSPGQINSGPALPAAFTVTNPVRTWRGADAETVSQGEKQISRYLQHRDRLVTTSDFDSIVRRTPGVEIGRVEVIPAFNPELVPNVPGDAPGAVTLMLIPKYDPAQPDAPAPDRLFMDTVCSYLNPRRLVTTEIFLRGPEYKGIWLSVGLTVEAGYSIAQVREDVKRALVRFLSPLPDPSQDASDPTARVRAGWPLGKPVVDLEVLAEANRVQGVLMVNQVVLAHAHNGPTSTVGMVGLQLPRLLGISVSAGDPASLDQLRGQETPPTAATRLPLPVIPEECG